MCSPDREISVDPVMDPRVLVLFWGTVQLCICFESYDKNLDICISNLSVEMWNLKYNADIVTFIPIIRWNIQLRISQSANY